MYTYKTHTHTHMYIYICIYIYIYAYICIYIRPCQKNTSQTGKKFSLGTLSIHAKNWVNRSTSSFGSGGLTVGDL